MGKNRESRDLGDQDDVNCNRARRLGRRLACVLAADRTLPVRARGKRIPRHVCLAPIQTRIVRPAPVR